MTIVFGNGVWCVPEDVMGLKLNQKMTPFHASPATHLHNKTRITKVGGR